MQTAIDPMTVKLADLDVLEATQSRALQTMERTERQYQPIAKRDARQQLIGAMRMINHFSGGDMKQDISTIDFLVQQIDRLEAFQQQLRQENAELRKALAAIGTVLEGHEDPFEVKPPSKWKKVEADKWMLAAGESIKWAMQRAENALSPVNAVPIAADPEV